MDQPASVRRKRTQRDCNMGFKLAVVFLHMVFKMRL